MLSRPTAHSRRGPLKRNGLSRRCDVYWREGPHRQEVRMSAEVQHALDYGWLHDDTEEDLVGADWHQDAIRALSISLKTLAEEHHWPWHVGDQLTLVGERPDGKDWRPSPDVSIHPQLGPEPRQDIDVRVEGPPALVLEVASASTWTYDVSLESTRRGKRQAGKALGYLVLLRVPEYLVFDPG